MTIKAIETRYAGCHFRSRLEARWAVFFDTMGIEWQYEPERFGLGQTMEEEQRCIQRSYLPDFYLPKSETWVEVKGSAEALDLNYLLQFCDYGYGLPGLNGSQGTARGLLLLGPVPRIASGDGDVWVHPILQHYKGVVMGHAMFRRGAGVDVIDRFSDFFACGCPWDDFWEDGVVGVDRPFSRSEILAGHPEKLETTCVDDKSSDGGYINTGMSTNRLCAGNLQIGYEAARSARFEHGQSGA